MRKTASLARLAAIFTISFGLLATSASATAAINQSGFESIKVEKQSNATEEPAFTAWQLPIAPDSTGQIHLLNPYRQPNSDYSAGHRGVDYRASVSDIVLAPSDGVISFAGRVANRHLVTIKHPPNLITEFEPVCPLASLGSEVSKGQVIGVICDNLPNYDWHCLEPCLHFSLRSDGRYLSPLALIGGLSPSRLLPLGRIV